MKRFPEEKLPQIFRLRRQGVPTAEIARQIGEPQSSVQREMRQAGIAYPNGKGRKKAQTA